jgi:GT2 family glycosyltransferase
VKITVVIPHLNQPAELAEGLRALHQQVGSTAEVSIIVVDNGSRELPTATCGTWPNVTLVTESIPGPGPARNLGVSSAGDVDVLSFIDADCRADERWLSAIETAFEDPEVEIIGGDIRLGCRDPAAPTWIETYEVVYSYRNEKHIREGFSGTGNLAVRPKAFAQVGPFAGVGVAEDRDWGLRANERGFEVRYVPEMIVYHPARPSFAELAAKWNRHIAHDYEHYAGRARSSRWLLRALAVAGSPVLEIPTILRTRLLFGGRQRLLSFLYLTRVRWYRAYVMAKVVADPAVRQAGETWNRT